jgi:hypothetical protein
MRYVVVDTAEFTYPDRFEYPTASDRVLLDTPRGTFATLQILVDGLCADMQVPNHLPREIYQSDELWQQASLGFARMGGVQIKTDLPFDIEWYALVPVTVEQNYGLAEADVKPPHFPVRQAPYRVYDCLRPFDGSLDVGVCDGREHDTGIGGVFGAIIIPADAVPGAYTATVEITAGAQRVSVPLSVTVYKATVPAEETLTIVQSYAADRVTRYHGVRWGSEEYYALDDAYFKALRRMRQNMTYMWGVKVTELGDNKYEFDFTEMENAMRRQLSQGIKYFNGPSIGRRESWHTSTILVNDKLPAMSYEAYLYLKQYLPALHDMLARNGWIDRFVMGISDEPNAENCTEWRALAGLVRRIVPDIRLIDAVSYGNIHGALDIWVPLNMEYDKHMTEIETFREGGSEIWHYVCCGPRSECYVNRFMDYPLLSTRYLLWGNYKYDLTGYLHWATNTYQPGQDPFRQNCPSHTNADSTIFLPPGDTHLIYPGEHGPWLSARGEAQRESAEECEMLKVLAKTDKQTADAICQKVFRSFCDVEYDVQKFRAARKQLLEALSEVK